MPERCGKEPATWVGLASPMRLDVPPGAAAEACRATRRTARGWHRRVLAAVDGRQGRVVPRDGAWIDGAHRADVGDPTCLGRMPLVDDPCPWPRRHPWQLTGMDPRNLQGHLNWHVYPFRVNQARDRWPEAEGAVRHLLMTDARFHSSAWQVHHPLSRLLEYSFAVYHTITFTIYTFRLVDKRMLRLSDF